MTTMCTSLHKGTWHLLCPLILTMLLCAWFHYITLAILQMRKVGLTEVEQLTPRARI